MWNLYFNPPIRLTSDAFRSVGSHVSRYRLRLLWPGQSLKRVVVARSILSSSLFFEPGWSYWCCLVPAMFQNGSFYPAFYVGHCLFRPTVALRFHLSLLLTSDLITFECDRYWLVHLFTSHSTSIATTCQAASTGGFNSAFFFGPGPLGQWVCICPFFATGKWSLDRQTLSVVSVLHVSAHLGPWV